MILLNYSAGAFALYIFTFGQIWLRTVCMKIAVLLDCVKEEMHAENVNRNPASNKVVKPSQAFQGTCFWSASVLELIERVLRPPEGGPPPLPEYCDAVRLSLSSYLVSPFCYAF